MQDKVGYIYIMANKPNGVLYIGVTSNLENRIHQHRNNLIFGFTAKYNLHSLVYYEVFGGIAEAISREKQLKNWRRKWKIDLIERSNPGWRDLYYKITDAESSSA